MHISTPRHELAIRMHSFHQIELRVAFNLSQAKLADFGLLKSNQGLATYMTTDVKGTAGYLDPEYFRANKVTTKSDVFG